MANYKNNAMNLAWTGAGALGGYALSQFGSNFVSNKLTEKDKTAGVAAKDVKFYKKAWFYDLAGGVVLGGVAVVSGKKLKSFETPVMAASSVLLARGVVDMILDLTAKDENKTYNGRPQNPKAVAAAGSMRSNAVSHRHASSSARSNAVLPTRLKQRSGVALY